MNRRFTIIGALAAVVIIGIGIAAYVFYSSGARVSVAPEGGVGLPVAGKSASSGAGPSSGDAANSAASPVAVSARLVKVSAGPVVPGASVVSRGSASASSSPDVIVRYVEQQSGNVFSYLVREKTLSRTSNRTVPGIRSAEWLPDGSTAFVRYLSDADSTINTYALRADGADGFFLPQNLADIAVSSTSVLALASGVNGSTASLLRTSDGARSAAAFSTPLSSLRVFFAGKSKYLAVARGAAELEGSAFIADASGRLSRIIGPRLGLSAIPSRSGKWILASYTEGGGMRTELVNAASGEELALPIKTLADKCVWSADDSMVYCGVPSDLPAGSTYPDDWYQGVAHFSDNIWKIEVAGRYTQLILDFSQETGDKLDAEALALDPLSSTLVFANKNDGSLWSYSL